MAGELGTPDKRLQFRGESVVLTPLTSDPASTEEGDWWFRSDLAPETNQIGTIRFDNGSSIDDIPIFETGTSGPDIEEVFRPFDSVQGYIPVTDTNPAFPYLGFQHAGVKHGLHDATTVSAIPASAVHRWKFSEGSGTTVADSIGTADGTVNGATWTSGTWQGGFALDCDGVSDYISTPALPPTGASPRTIAMTVEVDSTTESVPWSYGTNASGELFASRILGGDLEVFINGDKSIYGTVSTGTKYRIAVGLPSGATDVSNIVVYVNGAERARTGGTNNGVTINTGSTNTIEFARYFTDEFYMDGRADDPIVYDELLSASEMQADYDAQPWS